MIFPRWTHASGVLFYRNFIIFLHNFPIQIFEGLIQPILYLICFGYILGSWFDITVVSSYANFVYLGLVCSIPMSISFYETCYTSIDYLSQSKFKKFISLLPIKANDIYIASFTWSVFKSIFITGVFMILGSILKLVTMYQFIDIILVGFVVSCFFSSLSLFISSLFSWSRADFYKILYILIPLFLFSGVFFPVSLLPIGFEQLARYNPLGYGIYLLRELPIDQWSWITLSILCTYLLISYLLLGQSLRIQENRRYFAN